MKSGLSANGLCHKASLDLTENARSGKHGSLCGVDETKTAGGRMLRSWISVRYD